MPTIQFGSRAAANQARDRVSRHLTPADDRRSKTVRLKQSAPRRIVERLESEALGSQTSDRPSAGKATLTPRERESLKRQHRTFNWQSHGFEAMSVKAALQTEGATAWQDFYEPGEGVDSALTKLRAAKGRAGTGGRASVGIESMRTDAEELGNVGRRARQAERAMGEQVGRAKEPALLEADPDAIDFLEEEREFGGDVFDVSFNQSDRWGRPVATGRDAELLEERHASRSKRAQAVDEVKQAPVTRDPIEWTQRPGEVDFPGIDTVDPFKVHAGRSDRAQSLDESLSAPLADSPERWAVDPDELDLVGVDVPGSTPEEDALLNPIGDDLDDLRVGPL